MSGTGIFRFGLLRLGTGFKDKDLDDLHDDMSAFSVKEKPKEVQDIRLKPDVWFEPRSVWEINFEKFTSSPIYQIGAEHSKADGLKRGISVRYPIFLRVRNDKNVENATKTAEIIEFFKKANPNKL